MELSDFKIGQTFICGGKRFRCTDIGSRVVIAVPMRARVSSNKAEPRLLSEEETAENGWLNGPPYAVQEVVFDENDIDQCQAESAELANAL